MNKSLKLIDKKLLFLILIILSIPILTFAQIILIPCTDDCDYEDFLQLINNVINWIILVSFPVAAGVFAWAGFKLMTTGVVDQKKEAKEMFWKVFWGFVFILSAWIIVTTITNALLSSSYKNAVPVQGVGNNK